MLDSLRLFLLFRKKFNDEKGENEDEKTIKNLTIVTVVMLAMYKAIECYELLMFTSWKETLMFSCCAFALWAFWKANCENETYMNQMKNT